MFTFGIFTTHIPYIAMIAFYAYFLLFGVNKASEGEIRVTEKSHTIEIQTNDTAETISATSNYFYFSFICEANDFIFDKANEKQKWKHWGEKNTFPRDFYENALFGRPPPVLA